MRRGAPFIVLSVLRTSYFVLYPLLTTHYALNPSAFRLHSNP
jgi:hypothetical protein